MRFETGTSSLVSPLTTFTVNPQDELIVLLLAAWFSSAPQSSVVSKSKFLVEDPEVAVRTEFIKSSVGVNVEPEGSLLVHANFTSAFKEFLRSIRWIL